MTDPIEMTEEQYRLWCDRQDELWASTAAERELDAYLTAQEIADTIESDEL